jgi:hypothetical protein
MDEKRMKAHDIVQKRGQVDTDEKRQGTCTILNGFEG